VLSFFAGFGVFAVTRENEPERLMGTIAVHERGFPVAMVEPPVPQPAEAGGMAFTPPEEMTNVRGKKSKGKR
jgi:hypothetical protein